MRDRLFIFSQVNGSDLCLFIIYFANKKRLIIITTGDALWECWRRRFISWRLWFFFGVLPYTLPVNWGGYIYIQIDDDFFQYNNIGARATCSLGSCSASSSSSVRAARIYVLYVYIIMIMMIIIIIIRITILYSQFFYLICTEKKEPRRGTAVYRLGLPDQLQ